MRILLTNDDGIFADGLRVLAETLSKKHEVVVAAPEAECSGTGHSLTIFKRLSYQKYPYADGIAAYAVKGTPSDCVKFAVKVLMKEMPDIVISGINNMPNLGTDIIYSGTVNAALEGAICGIRSIAVSALYEGAGDYQYVSEFIDKNLESFYTLLLPNTTFNINFPSCKPGLLSGVRYASLGVQSYSDVYMPYETENHYYLTGDIIKSPCNSADCDVELHEKMYVTIAPLHIQMTDFKTLAALKKSKREIRL